MKEELAREKIEHEAASTIAAGAAERFRVAKDKETMGHIVGFADHMGKAPPVETPEYSQHVLAGVKKYPRMATTQWGKETLGKIAEEHDTIAGLNSRIPEGFEVDSLTVGANGRQSRLTAKRAGAKSAGKLDKLASIVEGDLAKAGIRPDEFSQRANVRRGRINNGVFSNSYTGAESGKHVAFEVDGTTYTMPLDEFTRSEKVHPVTTAPAATPVTPVPAAASKPAPEDEAAINWAKENPKDSRAAAIKKLHGIQ